MNLENNHLGDEAIITLINELSENRLINIVNLSKNKITDKSMESLSKYLRRSSSLLELYLHYNYITCKGSSIFFKGLIKN